MQCEGKGEVNFSPPPYYQLSNAKQDTMKIIYQRRCAAQSAVVSSGRQQPWYRQRLDLVFVCRGSIPGLGNVTHTQLILLLPKLCNLFWSLSPSFQVFDNVETTASAGWCPRQKQCWCWEHTRELLWSFLMWEYWPLLISDSSMLCYYGNIVCYLLHCYV